MRALPGRAGLVLVLNAFRHHRGGHAASSALAACINCAQRLSASQRWAFDQRDHHGGRVHVVLNAFRHHRGGHDCSLGSHQKPGSTVLNAFRHHRGGHFANSIIATFEFGAQRLSASQRWACAQEPGEVLEVAWCSTPFGITEVGIWCQQCHSLSIARAQRLSASQRWAFSRAPFQRRSHKCSTPFGITEVGIAKGLRLCRDRLGCSTPFGITEVGMKSRGARLRQRWRCSTPFGITEVGIRPDSQAPPAASGAQRLSASQRWACFRAPRESDRLRSVLNAFRHHRGGHGPLSPAAVGRRFVLNAFRHHRGGHAGRRKTRGGSGSRAQRLSASQRWALVSPRRSYFFWRAQRLSASQRWA